MRRTETRLPTLCSPRAAPTPFLFRSASSPRSSIAHPWSPSNRFSTTYPQITITLENKGEFGANRRRVWTISTGLVKHLFVRSPLHGGVCDLKSSNPPLDGRLSFFPTQLSITDVLLDSKRRLRAAASNLLFHIPFCRISTSKLVNDAPIPVEAPSCVCFDSQV